MISREQFLIKLYKYIGEFYRWSGKDLGSGLDCSGLIYNIFKYDFQTQPSTVMNAQGYYNYFKTQNCMSVLPGCAELGDLLFFGNNRNSISHIAMALDNKMMIEAAHGDSSVIDEFQAVRKKAKVMVNPITRRSDCVEIVRIYGLFK